MIGKVFDERPQRETFAREIGCCESDSVGQEIQPDGINLQLFKLRDKIHVLHEQFSILEQKTSSICKPMICKEQCQKDSPDGSEMQRFLKEQNQRLDGLLDRMTYMSESIDL